MIKAGGFEQMTRNGPSDDAQHLVYHGGISGKQIAQRKWNAQHPLP